MMKIAMLVEKDFQTKHFGVRNFFMTIKNEIEKEHAVDFVMHSTISGKKCWYRVWIESTEDESSIVPITVFHDDKCITHKRYRYYKAKNKAKRENEKIDIQFLGDSLKPFGYSVCIITNPWLIDGEPNIDISCYGLIHDFVANKYIFTMPEFKRSLDWANAHRAGYDFFSSHCNYIIANSKKTAQEYSLYYNSPKKESVRYIRPSMPYQYERTPNVRNAKENIVVLAAPFDIRKGLKKIPGYLNMLRDDVDTLYIYGEPRCDIGDFNNFFKQLKLKKIVYYPYISYKDLTALYAKAKFLFFPSAEEGLGIPLIEAQINGCRIVTTNREPMNELGVGGEYYLKGNIEKDTERMRQMLHDEFDYAALMEKARKVFSTVNIREAFRELF